MHLLVQETDKDRSIYGIQIFSAKRDLLYNTNRPSTAERKKNNMILELVERTSQKHTGKDVRGYPCKLEDSN